MASAMLEVSASWPPPELGRFPVQASPSFLVLLAVGLAWIRSADRYGPLPRATKGDGSANSVVP